MTTLESVNHQTRKPSNFMHQTMQTTLTNRSSDRQFEMKIVLHELEVHLKIMNVELCAHFNLRSPIFDHPGKAQTSLPSTAVRQVS